MTTQSIEEKFKSLERAGINMEKTKEYKSVVNAFNDLIDEGFNMFRNKFGSNETVVNFNAIDVETIMESNKRLYVVVVCSAIHWTLGLASAIYYYVT